MDKDNVLLIYLIMIERSVQEKTTIAMAMLCGKSDLLWIRAGFEVIQSHHGNYIMANNRTWGSFLYTHIQ